MPISTGSEEWQNAGEPTRFHKQVLAFFRDHPDQAYRTRELADELLDTTFEASEERDRLEAELPEEEYEDRLHEGVLPGGDDHSPLANMMSLRHIETALTRLLDDGLVEAREVEAEVFDLPEETTIVYTYAGDVDYED